MGLVNTAHTSVCPICEVTWSVMVYALLWTHLYLSSFLLNVGTVPKCQLRGCTSAMSVTGISSRSVVLLDGQSQSVDLMFLLLSPSISIVTHSVMFG